MSFETAPTMELVKTTQKENVESGRTNFMSGLNKRLTQFAQRFELSEGKISADESSIVASGMKSGEMLLAKKKTPATRLVQDFITSSVKQTTEYLKQRGLSSSDLVTRPVETIGKMFQIDSQTAARMLEMLGIKTQKFLPQTASDIFTRNAMAADFIGAVLMSAKQPGDDDVRKPHIPRPTSQVVDSAKLPPLPKRIIKRGSIPYPKITGEIGRKKIKLPGGHEINIPWPKGVGLTRGQIEHQGLVVDPNALAKQKARVPKVSGKGCLVGGLLLLGTCMGLYTLFEPVRNIIDTRSAHPTPTHPAPPPTNESFQSQVERLTFPNYESGANPLNFLDVKKDLVWDLTASGNLGPIDTWMWSRNTPDSLDFYRQILGDNNISQADIDRFRTDPNEFIRWLRVSGKEDAANFYQYRLTGNNGLPPTPEQFAKWAQGMFGQ